MSEEEDVRDNTPNYSASQLMNLIASKCGNSDGEYKSNNTEAESDSEVQAC